MTYYQKNREKILNYQKQYNLKNRIKIIEYQRNYYLHRKYGTIEKFSIIEKPILLTFD